MESARRWWKNEHFIFNIWGSNAKRLPFHQGSDGLRNALIIMVLRQCKGNATCSDCAVVSPCILRVIILPRKGSQPFRWKFSSLHHSSIGVILGEEKHCLYKTWDFDHTTYMRIKSGSGVVFAFTGLWGWWWSIASHPGGPRDGLEYMMYWLNPIQQANSIPSAIFLCRLSIKFETRVLLIVIGSKFYV